MSEISFGTRALHTSIERVRFSSYLPKVTRKNFDKPRIVDTVLSRKNFGSGDFRRTIPCRTRLSLSFFSLFLSLFFSFGFPCIDESIAEICLFRRCANREIHVAETLTEMNLVVQIFGKRDAFTSLNRSAH